MRQDLQIGLRVHAGVEELVERRGLDAQDGLLARDQTLLGHVARDLEGRRRSALAASGLEHVQFVALDRELQVLHVPHLLL